MKTSQFNLYIPARKYMLLFACIISLSVIAAPPDYDFRNPTLASGTALQQNARYRFANVRTGVDALVTIMAFTNGASLSQIDGPTGYVEAFQPVITVPANSNGYVEFRIQFVTSGTSAGMVMPQISSTSLDIDGTLSASGNLFEYDMVSLNNATSTYNYDMSTTELTMNSSAGWVTGTNVTGTNYSGVDTSARNVMFTVTNYNATSFRVRMGTDNRSTSATTRNKSIYFKNFVYSSGLLARNPLIHFTGSNNNAGVLLEWQMEKASQVENIRLEKSVDGVQFNSIASYSYADLSNKTSFRFSDYGITGDRSNYRLRITQLNGSISYSKLLTFYASANAPIVMKVYFEAAGNAPVIEINSLHETHGKLALVDLSGNTKYVSNVQLQKGVNKIRLDNRLLLKGGYHAAIIQVEQSNYSTKFLAQGL